MSKQITKKTQNSIHIYGATICFNGWDNVAWHPLLNVMFACPSGNVFISSIDIIGKQKDVHYICNALGGYIKTIRVNNIVQICIDNVSSMRSVVDLLIYHFQVFIFKVVLFIVWTCYWKIGEK